VKEWELRLQNVNAIVSSCGPWGLDDRAVQPFARFSMRERDSRCLRQGNEMKRNESSQRYTDTTKRSTDV
jgi:hypothetical protein